MVYQDRDQEMADAMNPDKSKRTGKRKSRSKHQPEPATHLPGGLHDDKLSPEAGATPPPGQGLGPQDTPSGDVTAAGGPHSEDVQQPEQPRTPPEPPQHGPVPGP